MCDLSIVVPLYKGKLHIKENIDELLRIKHSKEIIIVDDGSPDDSYHFCEKEFKDIPEISIYTKQNGGIVSSRNYGLERAEGKYILFVDQDDVVVSDIIDKSIDVLDNVQCPVLFW